MTTQQCRFAVLGANGYLGRHLASHLLASGHAVAGYDRLPGDVPPALPCQILNLADASQWTSVDTRVDAIFAFAGLGGTHRSFEQYENYVSSNELGLLHLLDCLRKRHHRPRVVFPSSRLVYRGRPTPLTEDAPKEAKTVYAANKLASEAFLQAYRSAYGIPYTVFRICVPYGNALPGAYSYGTIGAFIRMATEQKQISLYGDGSLRRTFTHVEDVCAQISATALLPDTEGGTFNIAGETASLHQVAEWLAERFRVPVSSVPWPEQERAIESGDTVFDDALIRRVCPAPLAHHLREWIAAAEFGA